jgi:signal transduction histidine kinase
MKDSAVLNELKIAHKALLIRHKDLEECANDLQIAYKNIENGELEKEKLAKKTNKDLEEMMFIVSHDIRKSVANILGISKLIYEDKNLEVQEWRELVEIIIQSAESLNSSSEELSKFIHLKKQI